MDLRKLKTLIDLVAESNIAELEITEGEGKVRIVKSVGPQVGVSTVAPMVMAPSAGVSSASAEGVASPSPASETAASSTPGHRQLSPMVGTFYRAASPGASPFVSVGDTVSEGQTLCVIEAMKLLNEIPADRAGVIKEILVENGQPVEFEQPLFIIG